MPSVTSRTTRAPTWSNHRDFTSVRARLRFVRLSMIDFLGQTQKAVVDPPIANSGTAIIRAPRGSCNPFPLQGPGVPVMYVACAGCQKQSLSRMVKWVQHGHCHQIKTPLCSACWTLFNEPEVSPTQSRQSSPPMATPGPTTRRASRAELQAGRSAQTLG